MAGCWFVWMNWSTFASSRVRRLANKIKSLMILIDRKAARRRLFLRRNTATAPTDSRHAGGWVSVLKPRPSFHEKLVLDKLLPNFGNAVFISEAKLPQPSFGVPRQAGALVSVERHEVVPLFVGDVSPGNHFVPLPVEFFHDSTFLGLHGASDKIQNLFLVPARWYQTRHR